MRKFKDFMQDEFWKITNPFWWISYIILGIVVFIWSNLDNLYWYLRNLYFLYFTLPKKDTKWYEDTVRNFETWCKTEECVEKIKRKKPLNYKCYIYCKNRLNG